MSHESGLYAKAGVDYGVLDNLKRTALQAAKETSHNIQHGKEVQESRGETAYVVEFQDFYIASTLECLGTKALIADEMRLITGKTYYDDIAHDVVTAAVNDLVAVGAKPEVIHAYWAVGKSEWFKDQLRFAGLIKGWKDACNASGVSWGGGESPSLTGVVNSDSIDLACSCWGVIKPKERLVSLEKIQPGDAILIAGSNGIHANGVSLARDLARRLPHGYRTIVPKKGMFGEALLEMTFNYSRLIQDLYKRGVDIHYMVNITGHGLRKLMRANRDLTYLVENLPEVPHVLQFMQEKLKMSDKEAYGTFNMGAGFAIFVPKRDIKKALKFRDQFNHYKLLHAGYIEGGPKKVVIKPKNIVYEAESLQIR